MSGLSFEKGVLKDLSIEWHFRKMFPSSVLSQMNIIINSLSCGMMCHDILEYPWGCSWKLRDKEATTVICLLLKGPMLWIHKKTAFIQRPNVCKSRHGLLNSLVTLNWLRMFLDSVWLFWMLVIWSLTLMTWFCRELFDAWNCR